MVNVFNVKNTGYFNIGMENEYRQEITLFFKFTHRLK